MTDSIPSSLRPLIETRYGIALTLTPGAGSPFGSVMVPVITAPTGRRSVIARVSDPVSRIDMPGLLGRRAP
jgi:hypothetical protein